MVNNKKIGIALGGGGARGLSHIGVLKVLEKEGIKIDYVVGVSIGAFIGAYYALGLDLEDIEKEAVSFTKMKAIRELLDLSNPKISILKGKKIFKFINKLIGEASFSDTKIPLRIITTDLANGKEVILSKGNIAKAVLASLSIPAIFPPVKIGNRYLIDGGVSNLTPVDTVNKAGIDIILGVDLVMKRKIKLYKPGLVTSLIQSYETIRTQSIKLNIDSVGDKMVLIKPALGGTIDSFKFYNIGNVIKAGEDAAKKVLPEIRKKCGIV